MKRKRTFTSNQASAPFKKPRQTQSKLTRTRAVAVGEMKYFDTEATNLAVAVPATTWAATEVDPETTINLGSAAVATPLCLCAPTVGSALNQRIGRKIKVLKIKVKGHIALSQVLDAANRTTPVPEQLVRLLLVQDMQTNAAQAQGEDILNGASAVDATINSFQNPNNFGRFRVLKDKFYTLQNPQMAGGPAATDLIVSALTKSFKFTINFRVPITCNFNATNGGTVADIIDNSFHLICGTKTTDPGTTISYYTRVCYKE